MEDRAEALLCRCQGLRRLEFEECEGLFRNGFWEQVLPKLEFLQDLTVDGCLDSDDELRGLAVSLSRYPNLQKLRLGRFVFQNDSIMAFTCLQTVLRNSPSHLVLDLSDLLAPGWNHCNGLFEPPE